jgi:hypothetical protein
VFVNETFADWCRTGYESAPESWILKFVTVGEPIG